jgi:hypothetical protein
MLSLRELCGETVFVLAMAGLVGIDPTLASAALADRHQSAHEMTRMIDKSSSIAAGKARAGAVSGPATATFSCSFSAATTSGAFDSTEFTGGPESSRATSGQSLGSVGKNEFASISSRFDGADATPEAVEVPPSSKLTSCSAAG